MPNKKPYFSAKRIKEIIQKLKAKVTKHTREPGEGIIPYYGRLPVTVMEIRHVMVILDSKRSTAFTLMKEIRSEYGKKPTQKISVTEFCKFTSTPPDDVRQVLNLLN